MAQRTQTIYISDISGDEVADGDSIEFSYRGVDYKIDLTQQEADKFDQHMAFYTDHAQRTGGRKQRKGGGAKTDPSQLQAARKWLKDNGYEVSDRGRIKKELMDIYNKATQ